VFERFIGRKVPEDQARGIVGILFGTKTDLMAEQQASII
jgi:hypothetical protein